MEQCSSDCVDLNAACIVLAKSRSVQALVKMSVGSEDFPVALRMMKAGTLDGLLGAKIHDLLVDTILDESVPIWTGYIHQPHDDYLVRVFEYHSIFWVWAIEYDPMGYFLDKETALAFPIGNWENVYEEGEKPGDEEEGDDEEGDGDVPCPYCKSTANCDHLLLKVDEMFRRAVSGLLSDMFNSWWATIIQEADDPRFQEREHFEILLNKIGSLSDAESTSSVDGGPGMSVAYSFYFSSSKKKALAALKKISKLQC